jgi:neurotransmitter-gated ion-channel
MDLVFFMGKWKRLTITRFFSHLLVIAGLSMLLVGIYAIPSQSAEISRPTDRPITVHVSIFIIDVDDINGASQSFDANVHIQYRWRDSRLAHDGQKAVVRAIDEIWNPKIQIINQQKLWLTLPDNVKIFPNGDILYHQRAWGSFSQPLKLHDPIGHD